VTGAPLRRGWAPCGSALYYAWILFLRAGVVFIMSSIWSVVCVGFELQGSSLNEANFACILWRLSTSFGHLRLWLRCLWREGLNGWDFGPLMNLGKLKRHLHTSTFL
jgi:hypothetical protein